MMKNNSHENSEHRTFLITGGAGFIGSNFIRYLLGKYSRIKVINIDKLTYAGNLENLKDVNGYTGYSFIKGDISDRKKVEEIFSRNNIDIVVNFAAESHVDRSILDPSPFLKTNISGTLVLLKAASQHDIKRFIQISTDEVYGSLGEKGRFNEESPLNPGSPYSASKASADLICKSFYRSFATPVIITRSSNNYGPYQFPEKLIPLMIKNALEGKELPVYGEGKNIRDWLHVNDNCRAIDSVINQGEPGEIYNVGGNSELRNIEVVRNICNIVSEETGIEEYKLLDLIEHIKDPRGKAHDFRYAMDCKKLRNDTGWEPEISFHEGLRKTVIWYIENDDWVKNVTSGEYLDYYSKVYGK